MAEAIIQAERVSRQFDELTAVDQLTLTVSRGQCFGLLGPNGAGKTSFTRMVQAVLPRSGGDLTVLGLDPDKSGVELRGRIGVVPQGDNLDPDLSVEMNLVFYARFFGIPYKEARAKARELLAFAQLTERAGDAPSTLSGGMRRRLILARAMVNSPELLLLDEPTTALDPQARHLVWAWLRDLKARGMTLLLNTHDMDEAERLCDQITVIDHGRVIAEGSPEDLIKAHVGEQVIEVSGEVQLNEQLDVIRESHAGTQYIYLKARDLGEVTSAIAQNGLSYRVRSANLEDVFLRLTGRELRA